MKLECEYRFYRTQGMYFQNYTVVCPSEESSTYERATNIPIDETVIKNEQGNIINLPEEIPDEDSTKKYMKYFAINKDIEDEIDMRQNKEGVLEQIYDELNINTEEKWD